MTITPWELVANSPNTLSGHVGMKYNNRGMIVGGNRSGVISNEVIGSRTGRNFDPVLPNPTGLHPRSAHAGCVFNERMWVTGGVIDELPTTLGDCVFSENGQDWIEMTAQGEYAQGGGLFGHRMVAFGNKKIQLVITGGYVDIGNQIITVTNKVWTSVGGKKWIEPQLKSSIFSGRAYHGCLVYNNRIWVMGGMDAANTCFSDVWYTEDLEHWVRCLETAPWGPLAAFGHCVWDERMWVIGGFNYDDRVITSHGVWFSRNGVKWEHGFDLPVATYGMAADELDNRIHIFGGVTVAGNTSAVYRMNQG